MATPDLGKNKIIFVIFCKDSFEQYLPDCHFYLARFVITCLKHRSLSQSRLFEISCKRQSNCRVTISCLFISRKFCYAIVNLLSDRVATAAGGQVLTMLSMFSVEKRVARKGKHARQSNEGVFRFDGISGQCNSFYYIGSRCHLSIIAFKRK